MNFDADFWRGIGRSATPGLFDMGVQALGARGGMNEAKGRLGASGMNEANAASMQALAQAGNMDPRAAAAERFQAQQGLLAGKDAKDEEGLIRMLRAKGMLGAASYNPGVKGITPDGTKMNPQMAAFYAARGGRDATMAAESLDAGNKDINMMLERSGMLQRQAASRQQTAQANRTPAKSGMNANLMKGGLDILKNTGLLKGGADWLFGAGKDVWAPQGGFTTNPSLANLGGDTSEWSMPSLAGFNLNWLGDL
jgi:hypothetical protein